MSFDKWRARLAGEKVMTYLQPDGADEGYYRKPITKPKLGPNGKTNGQRAVVGWIPIAYFLYEGQLIGSIGDRDGYREMTAAELSDEQLWSYAVQNPISYDMYCRAVDGAGWPDLEPVAVGLDVSDRQEAVARETQQAAAIEAKIVDDVIPAVDRVVARSDNQPPAEEKVSPSVEHATAIDAAIGAARKTVASEAEAAEALGSKNRIAELRLKADKAGKAVYQPLHASYVAARDEWLPMVNRAVTAEGRLQEAILAFRESERKRLLKIQRENEAKQKAIDEESERIAQRAIATGQPEPPPALPGAPATPPSPPPLVPTYGKRRLREELKKFPVIEDWDKLFQFFKASEDVRQVLTTLATAAIRAGITVPGTTVEERLG